MDDEEVQALRVEGLDPDNPAVLSAIDLVRWELSLDSNGHRREDRAFRRLLTNSDELAYGRAHYKDDRESAYDR